MSFENLLYKNFNLSIFAFCVNEILGSLLSVFKVASMCARTRLRGAFWFKSHSSPQSTLHHDHVTVVPPSPWTVDMMVNL